MTARPDIRRLVWLALLLATSGGLGAWYLSRPASTWYVSIPLDSHGRRAKVQVPNGWTLDPHASHLPTGLLGSAERVTLVFQSQEPLFARWLRRIDRQPAPPISSLYLDIGRKLELLGFDPATPADGIETPGGWFVTPPYLSYRVIKAGQPPIYGVAALGSEDKRTFDRFHTFINSFRIEVGGSNLERADD